MKASIYAGLAPRDRARAHVRGAKVLNAESGGGEAAAEHLLQTQRVGEPWAIGVLREAGRAALVPAAAGAASPICAARSTRSPPAQERAALLAELGEAEAATGDPAGAARLALAAEGSQSASARAQTLERLGGALWLLGQESAATEAFERGLVAGRRAGTRPAPRACRRGC